MKHLFNLFPRPFTAAFLEHCPKFLGLTQYESATHWACLLLGDRVISSPKATSCLSSEELKSLGVVGIYDDAA